MFITFVTSIEVDGVPRHVLGLRKVPASDLSKKMRASRKIIKSKYSDSDCKMEDIDIFTVRDGEIEETDVNDDEGDNGIEAIGDGVVPKSDGVPEKEEGQCI